VGRALEAGRAATEAVTGTAAVAVETVETVAGWVEEGKEAMAVAGG
jgi:hypothetical protein